MPFLVPSGYIQELVLSQYLAGVCYREKSVFLSFMFWNMEFKMQHTGKEAGMEQIKSSWYLIHENIYTYT